MSSCVPITWVTKRRRCGRQECAARLRVLKHKQKACTDHALPFFLVLFKMSLIGTFLSPFGIFDCLFTQFPRRLEILHELQNVEIMFKEDCPRDMKSLSTVEYMGTTATLTNVVKNSPKQLRLVRYHDSPTDICIANVFRLLTYNYNKIKIQRLKIPLIRIGLFTAANHHAVKFIQLCGSESTIGFEQTSLTKKYISVTSPDYVGTQLTAIHGYTEYGSEHTFTQDHARLLIAFDWYKNPMKRHFKDQSFYIWNWPNVPYSLLSSLSSRMTDNQCTQSGNCQTLAKLLVKFPVSFQELATTKWHLYHMFDQSVTPMPLQIIPDNIEPLRCTVEIESEIVVLPISSPDD